MKPLGQQGRAVRRQLEGGVPLRQKTTHVRQLAVRRASMCIAHGKVRHEDGLPLRIYEKITVALTQVVSADTAPAEIGRVLSACLSHQQPVYINLPSDVVVMMKCHRPRPFLFPTPAPSDLGCARGGNHGSARNAGQSTKTSGDRRRVVNTLQAAKGIGWFSRQNGLPIRHHDVGKSGPFRAPPPIHWSF